MNPQHDDSAAPLRNTAELDALKQQWSMDPCWDIEDSPGFEAHRTELYIFRLEVEREEYKREAEAHRKLLKLLHNAMNGDLAGLLAL